MLVDLDTRLRYDTRFYAEEAIRIVDKRGRVVPLIPNQAQIDFEAKLEEQRLAGQPMRAIILKARQLGMSTWTQAKFIQRVTQDPNHKAITIAQDRETAGALFDIAQGMYARLPDELKPKIRHRRKQRELSFGEPSAVAQESGDLGLNSQLLVDTAKEFEAGRGFTYRSLHASECAFWPDLQRKLTGLLNAVPDVEDTLIVLESTANGHNHFKTLWDQAEAGENDFAHFFAPWHMEPQYARPFLDAQDRARFVDTIGTGPWGEDEEMLVELYDLSPEQLHWRRWTIVNKSQGDLRSFKQEFPANPGEAFLSTGRQVFSTVYVSRLLEETKKCPPVETGELVPKTHVERRTRSGTVKVPTGIEWRQKDAVYRNDTVWKIWEKPLEGVHYVIACDPAKGSEETSDDRAKHAIQVIRHDTKVQVAEWSSQIDPDLVAVELFMAGVFWNKGWVAPETTGGWGLSIARRLWQDFNYPKVFTRKSFESRKENMDDRLGWDTNRASKPILEDGARELLREGTHGVRSYQLALEMSTYVRDNKGKTGPESGKNSDLLMAWMIAQQVALEKPIPSGSKATQTVRWRTNVNTTTGY